METAITASRSSSQNSVYRLSVFGNVAGTLLLSIAMGMTAVLFPYALQSSHSSSTIGALMSLDTLASFLICFAFPWLLRRLGMAIGLLSTVVLRLPALLFLAFYDNEVIWGLGIFVHAAGCYVFLLITQTWMNGIPFRKNIGFWMAVYSTSISLGIALGPVVIGLIEQFPEQLMALTKPLWFPIATVFGNSDIDKIQFELFIAILISTVAMLPIIVALKQIPRFRFSGSAKIWNTIMSYKGAMFAIAMAGVSYFGVMAFITVYGIENGLVLQEAALLLTAFSLGAIILEIPLGWLSDHFDRRYMIVACTFLCSICAAYLPLAIYVNYQAWILLFVWGGVVGAIYAIALALISERFQGEELISANAGYSVMEGIGGTIGILLIGLAMDYINNDGMPYVIMFACILYFSFALTRYRVV